MHKLKKIPVRKTHRALDMAMDLDPMFPPTFHITSKQMPESEDWEVGKKYKLVVEVEQTSKNESKGGYTSGSFDIVAYAPVDKDYENMSDEELEDEEASARTT